MNESVSARPPSSETSEASGPNFGQMSDRDFFMLVSAGPSRWDAVSEFVRRLNVRAEVGRIEYAAGSASVRLPVTHTVYGKRAHFLALNTYVLEDEIRITHERLRFEGERAERVVGSLEHFEVSREFFDSAAGSSAYRLWLDIERSLMPPGAVLVYDDDDDPIV